MRLPLFPSVRKRRPLHFHKLNDLMARFIDVLGFVVREEPGLHCLGEFVLVLPSPLRQVPTDHHVEEKISKGKPMPRSLHRCFQIGVPQDDPLMRFIPEAQQSVAPPGKCEHHRSPCPGLVREHPFAKGQPHCLSPWGPRLLEYGSPWDIGRDDIWPVVYDEHRACNTDFAFPYTLAHDRFPRSPRSSHDRFTFASSNSCTVRLITATMIIAGDSVIECMER